LALDAQYDVQPSRGACGSTCRRMHLATRMHRDSVTNRIHFMCLGCIRLNEVRLVHNGSASVFSDVGCITHNRICMHNSICMRVARRVRRHLHSATYVCAAIRLTHPRTTQESDVAKLLRCCVKDAEPAKRSRSLMSKISLPKLVF